MEEMRESFLNELIENMEIVCKSMDGSETISIDATEAVLGIEKGEMRELVSKITNALPDRFIESNLIQRKDIQNDFVKKAVLFIASESKPIQDDVLINFIYDFINSVKIDILKYKPGESLSSKSDSIFLKDVGSFTLQKLQRDTDKRPVPDKENREKLAQNWVRYLEHLISRNQVQKKMQFQIEALPKLKEFIVAKRFIDEVKPEFPEIFEQANNHLQLVDEVFLKAEIVRLENLEMKMLSEKEYANKLIDSQIEDIQIDKYSMTGLILLSEGMKGGVENKEKREFIQKFIKNSFGNMKLNGILKNFIQYGTPQNIDPILVANLNYLSFKTRDIKNFFPAYEKLVELYKKLEAGQGISDSEKMTLKEYSILNEMSKTNEIFETFNQSGLLIGSDELVSLSEKVKTTKDIIDKIEKRFSEEYKAKPEVGTMTFDNTQKKADVLGKVLSFFEKLVKWFVTKHGHAAKVVSKKDSGQAYLSHINPEAKLEKFNLRNYLYSDIYQIKLDKLILSEHQVFLKNKLGDNWLEEINSMYEKIESEIHENMVGRFRRLGAAPEEVQHKAGIADFLYHGHKQNHEIKFSEIHKKVFSDHYKKNNASMLCSEFVAYSAIAAMEELNIRLSKKLSLDKKDFVKIPFDKKENLATLHPDRLIKILKDKDCIVEVPKKESVQKMFKHDEIF